MPDSAVGVADGLDVEAAMSGDSRLSDRCDVEASEGGLCDVKRLGRLAAEIAGLLDRARRLRRSSTAILSDTCLSISRCGSVDEVTPYSDGVPGTKESMPSGLEASLCESGCRELE